MVPCAQVEVEGDKSVTVSRGYGGRRVCVKFGLVEQLCGKVLPLSPLWKMEQVRISKNIWRIHCRCVCSVFSYSQSSSSVVTTLPLPEENTGPLHQRVTANNEKQRGTMYLLDGGPVLKDVNVSQHVDDKRPRNQGNFSLPVRATQQVPPLTPLAPHVITPLWNQSTQR